MSCGLLRNLFVILVSFCASCENGQQIKEADMTVSSTALGQACSNDGDCPEGMECLNRALVGYCSVYGCEMNGNGCSDAGRCVQNTEGDSFCLPTCGQQSAPVCPSHFRCVESDETSVCAPAILAEDEACGQGATACQEALVCVEILPGHAACRPTCSPGTDSGCVPEAECAPLEGLPGVGVCMKFGQLGEGQECHSQYGSCGHGQSCVFATPDSGSGICMTRCELPDMGQCGKNKRCLELTGGLGACVPFSVSSVGGPCDPDADLLCEPELTCWRQNLMEPGVCSLPCDLCSSDSALDNQRHLAITCGDGFSCIPVGVDTGLCLEWHGGQPEGALCVADKECAPGLACAYPHEDAEAGYCLALCISDCPFDPCEQGYSCLLRDESSVIGFCVADKEAP